MEQEIQKASLLLTRREIGNLLKQVEEQQVFLVNMSEQIAVACVSEGRVASALHVVQTAYRAQVDKETLLHQRRIALLARSLASQPGAIQRNEVRSPHVSSLRRFRRRRRWGQAFPF
ncbi:hypothetical protein H1R20_g1889, partial [Candolleomyces eurysporus]